jgi:UDP-N-acetylmuramate--alanine ligase
LEAFGGALATADVTWVTEIYPAREEPIPGVHGGRLARAVEAAGGRVVHFHPSLEDLPHALRADLRAGDLCLFMGAGSIEASGAALLTLLQEGGRE